MSATSTKTTELSLSQAVPIATNAPAAGKSAPKTVKTNKKGRISAKPATDSKVKSPVKATVQASAKPSVKASAKTTAKPSASAKPKAAPMPTPDKPVRPKKPKLVRDSFTIPKAEYGVLDDLKIRAIAMGNSVKKSELLRAGIKALAGMPDAAFLAALKAVPAIKTGRPANLA